MRVTRWIGIKYKCSCMRQEATLAISERSVVEDISEFMDRVAITVSRDHSTRSPLCVARQMEYAKVPIDAQTGAVGGAEGGTA